MWGLEKQDPALPRVYCVRCPFISHGHQEAQLHMETWELLNLLSLSHTGRLVEAATLARL